MECTPSMTSDGDESTRIGYTSLPASLNQSSMLLGWPPPSTLDNGIESTNFFNESYYPNERTTCEIIEEFIYRGPVVVICLLGLIGNVLNLVVLTRKSLTVSMGRMERSAHYGLIGLAASDALFCSAVLPTVTLGGHVFGYRTYDFRIFYEVYSDGIIHTFILSSTWLTVSMAVSRYVAVCYPFKARLFIGKRFAVASLVVVFFVSVVFNVPRYFRSEIDSINCVEGGSLYFKMDGALTRHPRLLRAYQCLFFIAGIAVPFVLLAFCNVNLIVVLQRSSRLQGKNIGGGVQHADSGTATGAGRHDDRAANRITFIMIVIVASYILLVVPTETMTFMKESVGEKIEYVNMYNLLLAIFNMFEAANFAFSFLLYCVVSVHFRHTFCRLLSRVCCYCARRHCRHFNLRDLRRHRGRFGDSQSPTFDSTSRMVGHSLITVNTAL